MALTTGSVTYTRLRLLDPVPADFQSSLALRLKRHAFKEIDPRINPEVSRGWVNAMNPLDSGITPENSVFGSYLILGYRRDTKSVPAAIYKAKVREAMRARSRERKGGKLARTEVLEIRERVKAEMLATVSPVTMLQELVWNFETGDIFLSTSSQRLIVEVGDWFEESFSLAVEELVLSHRVESYIERRGMNLELVDIEELPLHR